MAAGQEGGDRRQENKMVNVTDEDGVSDEEALQAILRNGHDDLLGLKKFAPLKILAESKLIAEA